MEAQSTISRSMGDWLDIQPDTGAIPNKKIVSLQIWKSIYSHNFSRPKNSSNMK